MSEVQVKVESETTTEIPFPAILEKKNEKSSACRKFTDPAIDKANKFEQAQEIFQRIRGEVRRYNWRH
jgi:predicted HAD superfamily phosphohydrolase